MFKTVLKKRNNSSDMGLEEAFTEYGGWTSATSQAGKLAEF